MSGWIVAFVVFVIGGYYVWHFTGGGARKWAKHFGLDPDERVDGYWPAEFDTKISGVERAVVGAAGLALGSIATVRARGVAIALTTKNRIALVVENEDGKVTRLHYSPGELAIEFVGPADTKVNSMAAHRVVLDAGGGERLALRVAGNIDNLRSWSSRP